MHAILSTAPYFPDFAALQRHLNARGMFRINPGLDRVTGVLERLGLTRPPFVAVQVVGTNGKGSTSAMLEALARAHGLSTGLYTSPHLVSVCERIRVNGTILGEGILLREIEPVMRAGGADLTYFELLTALAVRVFAAAGVDLAVLESGLGGTWDAVSAVDKDLLLFTSVALDHTHILGSSLAEIAGDKAGAMRPGVPVLSAAQPDGAREALVAAAEAGGVSLSFAESGQLPLPAEEMGLKGPHQVDNAGLALVAWRHLCGRSGPAVLKEKLSGSLPDERREAEALHRVFVPGRLQRAVPLPAADLPAGAFVPCVLGRPGLILDGAHNPHGLAALGRALALAGIAPAATVFACMADKDVERMLAHVRVAAVGGPIIVPRLADNERAMPAEELADRIGLNAEASPSVREALQCAAGIAAERLPDAFAEPGTRHPVLICGSLYLLGEVFALWPDLLEQAQEGV